jgi:hypothetical protein
MDYARVRAYAEVYAMQDAVLDGQNEIARRFPTLGPVGTALAGTALAGAPRTQADELREARKPLAELLVAIGSHRVMAQGLRFRYRKILCYPETCPPESAAPAP